MIPIPAIHRNTETDNRQEVTATTQRTYQQQRDEWIAAHHVVEAKQRGIPLWMLCGFPTLSHEPDEDDPLDFHEKGTTMKHITYYTVIIGRRSCTVRYAVGPAYNIKRFPGTFVGPGEASQEFKITVEGHHPEYVKEGAFERKVSDLASQYQHDLARLADWNAGRPIRI